MFDGLKRLISVSVAVAIGASFPSTTYLSPDNVIALYAQMYTVDDVCKRLSGFKYEKDQLLEPLIKPSYVFLTEGKGDCKDFSNFAYECAKYKNVNCKYYLLFNGEGEGHATTIWKVDKKYYPICNVTCINKRSIKGYNHISEIDQMYIKAFKWKKIDYSYYATPYPFFWKPEILKSNHKKAEDF